MTSIWFPSHPPLPRKSRFLAVRQAGKPDLRTRRRAFTLVEMLVVISIIGMLMSLLLPAVMQSRAAARRSQCANNLRNVGLAMLNRCEAHRRFPASGYYGVNGEPHHSWVVSVLPFVERTDVFNLWDFDAPVTSTQNAALADTQISVLICPDDDSAITGHGNLSYVVNHGAGYMMPPGMPAAYHSGPNAAPTPQPFDLNGNGIVATTPATAQQDCCPTDRDLLHRLGMFFGQRWPTNITSNSTPLFHTVNTVRDGLSQTIMLSENVRAGYDGDWHTNWSTPDPWRVGFFVSGYICQNASCSSGNVDYTRANSRSGGPWTSEAINRSQSQPEGQAPWPSSGHVGGVLTMFADGHVHFLSDGVDGAVYVAVISPQGMMVTGALAQGLLGDDQY